MKISDILTEAISQRVYHYTSVNSALQILETGEFRLSSALGHIEELHAPPGYYYFLSTTRTLTGGYHTMVGHSAVMFNLSGDFYNRITKGAPVDYWQDRAPNPDVARRRHEAEDRIFSRTETLPIDGITSVHVFVRAATEKERVRYGTAVPARVRKLLIKAKIAGIPAYLYEDENAWRRQSESGRVSVSNATTLKGQEQSTRGDQGRRFYARGLRPWLELMFVDDKEKLSREANSLRYDLQYSSYHMRNDLSALKNDLHNASKHGQAEYQGVVRIVDFMRQNKLKSLDEFAQFLVRKWGSADEAA